MGLKQHNNLSIVCSLDGLPSNWRLGVEATVREISPLFDLYVTTVKAGARKSPEGVLISIAREGAEAAWTERVEKVLIERILARLAELRDQSRLAEVARLQLEVGWDASGSSKISVRDDLNSLTERERTELIASRRSLAAELRVVFQEAELAPQAASFCGTALAQMEHPERWALWVRLLLQVAETEAVLRPEVQRKMMELA